MLGQFSREPHYIFRQQMGILCASHSTSCPPAQHLYGQIQTRGPQSTFFLFASLLSGTARRKKRLRRGQEECGGSARSDFSRIFRFLVGVSYLTLCSTLVAVKAKHLSACDSRRPRCGTSTLHLSELPGEPDRVQERSKIESWGLVQVLVVQSLRSWANSTTEARTIVIGTVSFLLVHVKERVVRAQTSSRTFTPNINSQHGKTG